MQPDADPRLRRIAIQYLESLRSAGLMHLYRSGSDAVAGPPVAETHQAEERPPIAADAAIAAPVRFIGRSLFDEPESRPAETASVTNIQRSTLSLSERCEKLQTLAKDVAACDRCRELAKRRTQTVFGVGNPQASILFLGEAPGVDEDRQGEPFVGRAGQLLDRIITACRLKREEVYICNILKCRPPENRNPLPAEASNCREYLNAQIQFVDPDYIVCLGSVAAQNLLDTTTSIGRMRGRLYSYGRARVVCTYHPSYLLRTPSAKKQVWEDMKFLMRELGVELD